MGRRRKVRTDWRSRVKPELIEMLTAYRDAVRKFELSKDTSEAAVNKASEELQQRLRKNLPESIQDTEEAPEDKIHQLFAASMQDNAENSNLCLGLIEKLHWLRNREPFAVTMCQREKGDPEAIKKVYRTLEDFDRRHLAGEGLPKVKVDYDHDVIFSTGWGLGLENLTQEEELAEFFDELCPCGKRGHEGHALRMQRNRMFQALRRA